ncbi:uncharacterized protein I206_103181 [Kwoniella pini CBS 10737]|uniref:Uncharacterized protein n=1 Tax=Kwoniella pini CBS 10737 TaxID=1296096 RepID=A0A1B9IAT8_9TREE|nr:uncharacterized protein I206_01815 [Kwoniella pini CBS 10737]OCF52524.1 hypothetical protein I206_01815 [Kwoniella pini CBS 10737]
MQSQQPSSIIADRQTQYVPSLPSLAYGNDDDLISQQPITLTQAAEFERSFCANSSERPPQGSWARVSRNGTQLYGSITPMQTSEVKTIMDNLAKACILGLGSGATTTHTQIVTRQQASKCDNIAGSGSGTERLSGLWAIIVKDGSYNYSSLTRDQEWRLRELMDRFAFRVELGCGGLTTHEEFGTEIQARKFKSLLGSELTSVRPSGEWASVIIDGAPKYWPVTGGMKMWELTSMIDNIKSENARRWPV